MSNPIHTQDVQTVIEECLDRHIEGEKKYGVLDIDSDPRDFVDEMIEEFSDIVNYTVYHIIRLKKHRGLMKHDKILINDIKIRAMISKFPII